MFVNGELKNNLIYQIMRYAFNLYVMLFATVYVVLHIVIQDNT